MSMSTTELRQELEDAFPAVASDPKLLSECTPSLPGRLPITHPTLLQV